MSVSLKSLLRKSANRILNPLGLDLVRRNLDTSEELLLKAVYGQFDIRTVLDVGANEGLYAESAFNQGFDGEIYSFEPIGAVFEKLQARAAGNGKWHAVNKGVGSSESEAQINVSENLTSSSVLEITNETVNVLSQTRTLRNEKIYLTTVDAFIKENHSLRQNIFLKLDIQGYELEALKGAEQSLPLIKVIQAELSFGDLYHGAPRYTEIVDFLAKFEFEIFSIIPGFRDLKTGRMLQADGIFINNRTKW